MRMTRTLAAMLVAALAAASAHAHPTSAELAGLFARGDYLPAAERAEAAAQADDLAFAARALLAEVMTGEGEPDAALVRRARADAEKALQLAPTHEEARLQLAIAISVQSRALDALDVWALGLGEKGRQLAREVLNQNPANFYAHGFLAVWNVEVRRRGGTVGAGFMGASVAEGRRHYQEAIRLAPDDIGVHWQWARALVSLDAKRYGAEAGEALARAVTANADDHVDQVMRARAEKLAEALKGDVKSAQQLARSML